MRGKAREFTIDRSDDGLPPLLALDVMRSLVEPYQFASRSTPTADTGYGGLPIRSRWKNNRRPSSPAVPGPARRREGPRCGAGPTTFSSTAAAGTSNSCESRSVVGRTDNPNVAEKSEIDRGEVRHRPTRSGCALSAGTMAASTAGAALATMTDARASIGSPPSRSTCTTPEAGARRRRGGLSVTWRPSVRFRRAGLLRRRGECIAEARRAAADIAAGRGQIVRLAPRRTGSTTSVSGSSCQ